MKRFIGFVTKEFYHIFRDKRSMFILFGMPIAQIMLFGFAITNEINNVNIAILDKSKDTETQKIINKISASSHFHIEQEISSENQIESIFKKGKVKAVLVFQNNFIKDLETQKQSKIQVITDATDPNIANTITNYINAILQNYMQEANTINQATYQIQTQTQLY
jgi:ABC-2 type transport system permease protein